MHPVLYRFGNFPIGTYGLAIIVGWLTGLWLASHLARRRGDQARVLFRFGVHFDGERVHRRAAVLHRTQLERIPGPADGDAFFARGIRLPGRVRRRAAHRPVVHAPKGYAPVGSDRHRRAGHRAGPRVRADRLLHGRVLLRPGLRSGRDPQLAQPLGRAISTRPRRKRGATLRDVQLRLLEPDPPGPASPRSCRAAADPAGATHGKRGATFSSA